MIKIRLVALLALLVFSPLVGKASARNIPGHMLSGIIAYQVLQQESPQTIEKVKPVLEKHPLYANQWQAWLQDVPIADRDLVMFMQAARWADDVRIQDKTQKTTLALHQPAVPPDGKPPSIQSRDPSEHPNRDGGE